MCDHYGCYPNLDCDCDTVVEAHDKCVKMCPAANVSVGCVSVPANISAFRCWSNNTKYHMELIQDSGYDSWIIGVVFASGFFAFVFIAFVLLGWNVFHSCRESQDSYTSL